MELPATRKKCREASFFLGRLKEEAQRTAGDAEAFDFYLSEFLSAGRSVTFALQGEAKPQYDAWYPSWESALPETDRDLLDT